MNILKITGLGNRIAVDYDIKISQEKIDFTNANNELVKEREKSIKCLEEMLER